MKYYGKNEECEVHGAANMSSNYIIEANKKRNMVTCHLTRGTRLRNALWGDFIIVQT